MREFGVESGYEVKSLDGGGSPDIQMNQMSDIILLNPVAVIIYLILSRQFVKDLAAGTFKG